MIKPSNGSPNMNTGETRAPAAPQIESISDVDGIYRHAVAQGLQPQFAPRDAEWGEHYFHITDPDGHELSFAMRVRGESLSHATIGV